MRIALVSPYSLEVFGGVQTQVLGLARALSPSVEVTLLAPGAGLLDEAFQVEDLGTTLSVPVNGSRAPIALSPGAWRRTAAALRRSAPDVVHIHEPFVPAVGMAALLGGRPVVATFHRAGLRRGYRAAGPALARLVRHIGVASAVSEAAAETVQAVIGRGAGPLALLPNGIDPASYAGTKDRPDHAVPTIVFVGRLEQRKGLSVLLEAMTRLDIDLTLQVIGSGPEERVLRARAATDARVTFLGAIGDNEKAQYLREADLFVAPSLGGESFGVILLEAMAAGAPVVAADLAGYQLAAGDAAEYFPAGDPSALAEVIQRLLRDELRRHQLVLLGEQRAQAHSFDQLAFRYQELYAVAAAGARWSS